MLRAVSLEISCAEIMHSTAGALADDGAAAACTPHLSPAGICCSLLLSRQHTAAAPTSQRLPDATAPQQQQQCYPTACHHQASAAAGSNWGSWDQALAPWLLLALQQQHHRLALALLLPGSCGWHCYLQQQQQQLLHCLDHLALLLGLLQQRQLLSLLLRMPSCHRTLNAQAQGDWREPERL
jgi:hypothetical protein